MRYSGFVTARYSQSREWQVRPLGKRKKYLKEGWTRVKDNSSEKG
jgi:hypothetical protein